MNEALSRDGRMSRPRLSAVVACLLDGIFAHKAIAQTIGVSKHTVQKDLQRVRRELGARNTFHAALLAREIA